MLTVIMSFKVGILFLIFVKSTCVLATPSRTPGSIFNSLDITLPYVESHKLSDGTVVDCVKVEDQLTLQDPRFKDHVIQKPPANLMKQNKKNSKPSHAAPCEQLFHREVGSCPVGTIPVLREDKETLQAVRSLQHHRRTYNSSASWNSSANVEYMSRHRDREYAIVTSYGAYWGMEAYASIWNVPDPLTHRNDFTISQMWLVHDNGPGTLNSIEVGWHVHPAIYGTDVSDVDPRLFIFWTAHEYEEGPICYNLRCAGFVQMDYSYVFGAKLSMSDGAILKLSVAKLVEEKDADQGVAAGHWWLSINDQYIGYWPQTLFTHGQLHAGLPTEVQWGGEVAKWGPTSVVRMGNGRFGSSAREIPPFYGTDTPAYFCHLNYMMPEDKVSQLELFTAHQLQPSNTAPALYDSTYMESGGEMWLFYGGPGGERDGDSPPPSEM